MEILLFYILFFYEWARKWKLATTLGTKKQCQSKGKYKPRINQKNVIINVTVKKHTQTIRRSFQVDFDRLLVNSLQFIGKILLKINNRFIIKQMYCNQYIVLLMYKILTIKYRVCLILRSNILWYLFFLLVKYKRRSGTTCLTKTNGLNCHLAIDCVYMFIQKGWRDKRKCQNDFYHVGVAVIIKRWLPCTRFRSSNFRKRSTENVIRRGTLRGSLLHFHAIFDFWQEESSFLCETNFQFRSNFGVQWNVFYVETTWKTFGLQKYIVELDIVPLNVSFPYIILCKKKFTGCLCSGCVSICS